MQSVIILSKCNRCCINLLNHR